MGVLHKVRSRSNRRKRRLESLSRSKTGAQERTRFEILDRAKKVVFSLSHNTNNNNNNRRWREERDSPFETGKLRAVCTSVRAASLA